MLLKVIRLVASFTASVVIFLLLVAVLLSFVFLPLIHQLT